MLVVVLPSYTWFIVSYNTNWHVLLTDQDVQHEQLAASHEQLAASHEQLADWVNKVVENVPASQEHKGKGTYQR